MNAEYPLLSNGDRLAGGVEPSGGEDPPFSLLEHLPIGLLVVEPGAHIVFVNEYVEQMLGYGRGELLGQSVEMLVPERSRIEHADMRRVFAGAPRERPMGTGRDLVARHRDGSGIPVEIGLKPIRSQGRDYVLAIMVDIPRSRHDPKILWVDDAEIVGDRITKVRPIPRNLFTQKTERRIGELGASCVALVVSDVSVHEAP